jgi:predicted ATPase
MRLSSFEIKNLRSIEKLSVIVPNGLMVLVGQNSSGKSNVFRGLELFFSGKLINGLFPLLWTCLRGLLSPQHLKREQPSDVILSSIEIMMSQFLQRYQSSLN